MNLQTTVAFTGYRTEKIRQTSEDPQITWIIRERLDKTVEELFQRGFRTFLSGMASGSGHPEWLRPPRLFRLSIG